MDSDKKLRRKCCILGCKSNHSNTPNLSFYCFPTIYYKLPQRKQWIQAIEKHRAVRSSWEPKKHSLICSAHFINNKKSDHPLSPSFAPTIFPNDNAIKLSTLQQKANRHERFIKRVLNKRSPTNEKTNLPSPSDSAEIKTEVINDILPGPLNSAEMKTEVIKNIPKLKKDQRVQAYFPNDSNHYLDTIESSDSHFIHGNYSDVAIQVYIPPKIKVGFMTNTKDKCCGTYVAVKDVAVGPNQVIDEMSNAHSFDVSSVDEVSLLELAGVNMQTFQILLKIMKENPKETNSNVTSRRKVSIENRLFIFLMKLKTGLNFPAIGAIFQVDRTTVSKIFFSTLNNLASECQKFIVWPSSDEVKSMMPAIYKLHYKNCRVIIDCIEIPVEEPRRFDLSVQMNSGHKKTSSVKVLLGCTPNGLISFVSKSYTSRATDVQITPESGFINNLELNDIVLATMDFPQIKAQLDECGIGTLLVIPPLLENIKSIGDTVAVSRVRNSVEKIMQRIKLYRVLDKVSARMLPFVDDLLLMCCALINLQQPYSKENTDN